MAEHHKAGMDADSLFSQYTTFGEDPFIVPEPDNEGFSARDYAKQRCAVLCGLESGALTIQHGPRKDQETDL